MDPIDFKQYLKKYVKVTYKDQNETRIWEGCLHETSEEFIFVAGKYSIPIRKTDITKIEITRQ